MPASLIATVLDPMNRATDSVATYDTKADAFCTALVTWTTEANALSTAVNAQSVSATADAAIATAQAAIATTKASEASASAASALTNSNTQATSTASMTVGTGAQAFTLAQTGKSYVVGQWVSITDTASPSTRWMLGAITAFNSGTGAITVAVVSTAGTGTNTAWTIVSSAPVPVAGLGGYAVPIVVSGTTQAAVGGQHYVCTNAAGVTTVTLPASPSTGDQICIDNNTGRFDLIVARNGKSIQGVAEDMTFNAQGSIEFRYIDGTNMWRIF
jgi:hypothetical protein